VIVIAGMSTIDRIDGSFPGMRVVDMPKMEKAPDIRVISIGDLRTIFPVPVRTAV